MHRIFGRRPGVVPGLVLLCAATTSIGSEPSGPGRWVSTDAAAYIEVERAGALIDRLTGDAAQAMLGSIPSFNKALEGKEYRQFRAAVELVTAELGTTWREALRDLTAGGVALAVEASEGHEPGIYLFVRPKDEAFLTRAHDVLLKLAREHAAREGRPDPIQQHEYRGRTVYSVAEKEAHAIVDGMLVVASGGEALKALIDRVEDGWDGPRLVDSADWEARRAGLDPEATARGLLRLDRLREIDPKSYAMDATVDPGATLLFGPWIETLRQAPWLAASLTWTDARLGAELAMPTPEGGLPEPLKAYLPPEGQGAPAPLRPPGTIATANLWRDLHAIWEARAELFPAEFVQGLAQLDTFAGTFFGREFGEGVLGAIAPDWRLVVAEQDPDALDPRPDLRLPAFALVVGLEPGDDEFAQRLKVAFQSFVGLANLGAAQTKAPPLEMGSEKAGDATIAVARFMRSKDGPPAGEPVHYRHNFSPSAVQVGDHFVLSSSVGLARDLVAELQKPAGPPADATLLVEADGAALARLVEVNRERLVMQNMLEKGNDKAKAEEEVDVLGRILRALGRGELSISDAGPAWRATLDFRLGPPPGGRGEP